MISLPHLLPHIALVRRSRLVALAAILLAPLALGVRPDVAVAQKKSGVPPIASYGKWPLLLGAVGMNVLAAQAHGRADDAYSALQGRCDVDQTACATDPTTGVYLDPVSETLYQHSLSKDHEARLWLIGGETALLGAATIFIWELARPEGPPDNVPFDPQITTGPAGETRIGLRVRW
jgi:hypothetical protein